MLMLRLSEEMRWMTECLTCYVRLRNKGAEHKNANPEKIKSKKEDNKEKQRNNPYCS